jgi:hypothetical protein
LVYEEGPDGDAEEIAERTAAWLKALVVRRLGEEPQFLDGGPMVRRR